MIPQIFTRIRRPIIITVYEAGRNPKMMSRSDLVFVEIVTESKNYHIYKVVLLTIKVAARNASESTNS
jgi:hypothetical protein